MVLDGKKVENSILDMLNPNDIESINVLKGASAITLYGDEGKYGVVLIATKEAAKKIVIKEAGTTHNISNISTASIIGYGDKDDSGVKNFLEKNPAVKDVYWWAHKSLKMQIELKDGTEET